MDEEKKTAPPLPSGELSPNFKFKLIMGVIFLFFTIYFLYLLVRILTV